ncbi:hypothetical protein O6H91_20G014900 [Diphasiastrum complanatum]|nr:hypothetical protein O6H91_20G014900 [Diphasiastrum complanatum]
MLLFMIQSTYCRKTQMRAKYQTLHVVAPALDEHEEVDDAVEDVNVQQEGSLTLRLMHRDAVDSHVRMRNLTRQQLLLERIARDEKRLEFIKARIDLAARNGAKPENALVNGTWEASRARFSGPISSGQSLGSGDYIVRLGVGTPTKQMDMIIDTGSDLSWLQCSPCTDCYHEPDPVFSPSRSSSYKQFTCSSTMCQSLGNRGCQRNGCTYELSYDDGSVSSGNLASETFSDGSSSVSNIVFGCGHDNEGDFSGADGLIGLGIGALSFARQIASPLRSSDIEFSYCLPVDSSNGGKSSSSLIFGNSAIPSEGQFTTYLINPSVGPFYYLQLTGISIAGSLLSIPVSTFEIRRDGSGGVILDTGTTVTRLPMSAYVVMRNVFRALTRNLPSASPVSIFDTCYDLSGLQSASIPSVQLHFQDEMDLNLPVTNYMLSVDDDNSIYCLAFAGTAFSEVSIIGNIQQQGYRIAIDGENIRIAFIPGQC